MTNVPYIEIAKYVIPNIPRNQLDYDLQKWKSKYLKIEHVFFYSQPFFMSTFGHIIIFTQITFIMYFHNSVYHKV